MPLWSEREGQRRGLTKVDFRNALFEVLEQLQDRRLFLDAWGEQLFGWGGYIEDPERWVRDNLKDSTLWEFLAHPRRVYGEWEPEFGYPKPKSWGFGVLFDIVELLHRDAVAISGDGPDDYDQAAGRQAFRDAINPVLAQLEPPKVLTDTGTIENVSDVAKVPINDAIVHRFSPQGQQPALPDEVYEHIVTVMRRVGDAMELAPATYARLGEEARRDIYLVVLNTHYEDQTAGEAFNHGGKTDVRVRAEGRNVFIAECKIWRGPKTFTDALDQLFSYAAWRDTKLALVIFVPNEKLSDVVDQARTLLEAHKQFRRWLSEETTAHPLRARVSWRADENQEADLAVFLVHIRE